MFDRTFIVKRVEDDDIFYRKFHVDSTGTFMKGRKEPKPDNRSRQETNSDKGEARLTNSFNKVNKVAPEANAKPNYSEKKNYAESDAFQSKHKKHAESEADGRLQWERVERVDRGDKHKPYKPKPKEQRHQKPHEFERLYEQMSQLR
jgi:hypothetical protein